MENALACLIVADDFTGSCDTGLQFAQAGLRSRVVMGASAGEVGETDVLVWDTETRNAAPEEARQRVEEVGANLAGVEARVWYKKIDSTLRGAFAAEIEALMDARGFDLCLLAPAFPAAGRITVGGYHLLHGVPVARTGMGVDLGAPVGESFLPNFFAGGGLEVRTLGLEKVAQGPEQIAREIQALGGSGRVVVVLDAAAPADLQNIAQAAAQMEPAPLLCGSAGLAAQVPGAFGLESAGKPAVRKEPTPGPVLIVAGSTQELTRQQLGRAAREPGLKTWNMPTDEGRLEEIKDWLLQGDDVVLCVGEMHRQKEVARAIGSLTRAGRFLAERVSLAGVVVTGGWTAVELLQALDGEGVEILEQVDEGVPLCRLEGGPFQGLSLVTKAGALGGEEVYLEAMVRLKEPTTADRPLLGITMGDPGGIGPEIMVKALSDPEVWRICRPLVIGHPAFLEKELHCGREGLSVSSIDAPEDGMFQPERIEVWNPVDLDLEKIQRGQVCPEGGKAAAEWVKAAVDLALEDRIDGIVTAPLNKEAMNRAGYHYAGHTELLGERTGAKNYRMMLASEWLKVVHATTHVALRQVPERLTVERVFDTIALTQEALVDLGFPHPRLGVAGLNPHAGESGLFGDEDAVVIRPAVDQAREQGWEVQGPLPGDTLFLRAWQGEFDAVVAMYHDQGHIPAKLVAFAEAVNVTLGLPIVRTSVDHGTAFDLVGKGVADHKNMVQAIRMGARLAAARRTRARS